MYSAFPLKLNPSEQPLGVWSRKCVLGISFHPIDQADGPGAVTVTVPEADLLGSTTLVAVTVSVPAEFGAVYSPLELMVPPLAIQVTTVFELPVTVAVNCCVAPVWRLAEAGLIVIDTTGGVVVTVTAAEAFFVVSATLVAVTVNVPADAVAVYNPPAVMVPPVAVHVTDVFVLPVTVAVNCCVPPTCTEAADRFRETDTPLGLGELLELPLTIPEQPHASTKHGSNAITVADIPANLFAPPNMRCSCHNWFLQNVPNMITRRGVRLCV